MPDLSERSQLVVVLVVANLAARGWLAAGIGATLGFLGHDLALIPSEESFELAHLGMMATAGAYLVVPGLVVAVVLALVRRFVFPRVVWGNAHWIFPLFVAVAGLGVGVFMGG